MSSTSVLSTIHSGTYKRRSFVYFIEKNPKVLKWWHRCSLIYGVQYVVEEMNILTTVFLGEANAKVWIPNSVLANKLIQNFYRSPEMGDGFEFVVHASTPAEKIATLKENIGK